MFIYILWLVSKYYRAVDACAVTDGKGLTSSVILLQVPLKPH